MFCHISLMFYKPWNIPLYIHISLEEEFIPPRFTSSIWLLVKVFRIERTHSVLWMYFLFPKSKLSTTTNQFTALLFYLRSLVFRRIEQA